MSVQSNGLAIHLIKFTKVKTTMIMINVPTISTDEYLKIDSLKSHTPICVVLGCGEKRKILAKVSLDAHKLSAGSSVVWNTANRNELENFHFLVEFTYVFF